MQEAASNKAVSSKQAKNKDISEAETKTPGEGFSSWQFSGDGVKPPVTIYAASLDEAKLKYGQYLNE